MRAEDCKELFKLKDGTFLRDLGSAAPMSVVALGEVMEDLSRRGTAGNQQDMNLCCLLRRTQRNEPAPLPSTHGRTVDWAFEQERST